MWSIIKPSLADTRQDIGVFQTHNIIDQADAIALESLVGVYDTNGGSLPSSQSVQISNAGEQSLYRHYKDTESGKPLNYIRESLNKDVFKCPYCSVNQPDTLDHFMPKGQYKALSLCRLNLVPMCWSCNNKKGHTHPYSEYIHPYYLTLPQGTIFLIANISVVGNILVFRFSFDQSVLNGLYQRFVTHWRNMDLDETLKKAVVDFLSCEILPYVDNHNNMTTTIGELLIRIQEVYGLNDWRSAVLRALLGELQGKNRDRILAALRKMKTTNRRDNTI